VRILADKLIFKTNMIMCVEIIFIMKPIINSVSTSKKASLFAPSEIQAIAHKKKTFLERFGLQPAHIFTQNARTHTKC